MTLSHLHIVNLVTTDVDRRYEQVARMATSIIEITHENGICLPNNLNELGYSSDEVERYWNMAMSLASVELKLMKDGSNLYQRGVRQYV